MASQLLVDLYECDVEIIDNMEKIKNLSHKVIKEIGSEIVEECFHKFSPIGITYIAVITTSHFSIHTWPEYKYVAVDVFSCDIELVAVCQEIYVLPAGICLRVVVAVNGVLLIPLLIMVLLVTTLASEPIQ